MPFFFFFLIYEFSTSVWLTWFINSIKSSEEIAKLHSATKQGLLGFIIAILAYLDLKAAPFFIIWVVSYYLDV